MLGTDNVTVTTPDPIRQIISTEVAGFAQYGGDPSNAFVLPIVLIHQTNNPVGHREHMHTELRSYGASQGKFVVGANIGVTAYSGAGNLFALNGVTIVQP